MATLKEERANKKLQKESKRNPEAIIKQGLKCHSEKDFDNAIKYLTQLLKNPEFSVQAYHFIGLCYFEQKQYELALKNYNESILLKPSSGTYIDRGNCYLKKENYELALADFNTAIDKLNSKNANNYYNRGNCYLKQKNYEQAIADFNESIRLKANDPIVYNNLGNAHCRQENYDLALEGYNNAININPKYANAYNGRGNCYRQLEKYELALVDYNKAIDLNDKFSDFYINRAFCYLELNSYELAFSEFNKIIKFYDLSKDKKDWCFLFSNMAVKAKKYKEAKSYIEQAFEYVDLAVREYKDSYLKYIDSAEELDRKNEELELQIEETKKVNKALHEKEKEMLSFFTHTMRNALATAPESLRQAIRLLGSEDYESNQKHYKAINKIAALFSTLSLTDCLIDTFKQSISEPEEFQRAWQNDNEGEATPKWVIAAALRQSLNRIIFMSDTSELRQLLINADTPAIVAMRKSFIDNILPLNLDNQGIAAFYQWLSGITTLEIAIENHDLHFGVNQVKFSLLFAISSELILNALKYWNGSGKIQIRWYTEQEQFIFKVTNACETNASSSLAGTHKGIAFIKRLMELLGEHAQFNCSVEEQLFTAELKLHQSLLESNR